MYAHPAHLHGVPTVLRRGPNSRAAVRGAVEPSLPGSAEPDRGDRVVVVVQDALRRRREECRFPQLRIWRAAAQPPRKAIRPNGVLGLRQVQLQRLVPALAIQHTGEWGFRRRGPARCGDDQADLGSGAAPGATRGTIP